MTLLSLEAARERINSAVPRLPAVRLPFVDAAGHTLAEAITAREDLPPWPNSAMDGYAVRAGDVRDASPERPVTLRVLGDLPAGRAPAFHVGPGEAVRIMTGAPIPDGSDGVVIVENTSSQDDLVHIQAPIRAGENIRRAGENVARGETVLVEGKLLRSSEIGLLASLGFTEVLVYRKPVVGVISSGDELVPPGETPGPGRIRDSNRFTLAVHLRALGFEAVDFGNAPDRAGAIEELFRLAAARCDALVSTGGVSVGDYDLTKAVLSRLGTMEFWRVAIRPGKPLAFGFMDGRPVFGLPGNPVSSLVVLDQIVRPALRRMAGHRKLYRDVYRANLEESIRRTPGRTEFMRAVIRYENGRFLARSTGAQGSGVLKSMSIANGLIIVPSEVESLPSGTTVDCQLFAEDI
jgi:molybdopterin molybdotransferase